MVGTLVQAELAEAAESPSLAQSAQYKELSDKFAALQSEKHKLDVSNQANESELKELRAALRERIGAVVPLQCGSFHAR